MYETHDKRALLLPDATVADAGKVLAVDENGKLSLEAIGSGLPEVDSSDAGMVLTVSEEGEWEAASADSGLPEVDSSDAGDVLTVNASGEWEAAAPSGGGLTLYGPYYASLSESVTINAGDRANLGLYTLTSDAGDPVNYPDTGGKCFMEGVFLPTGCIRSFCVPTYGDEWYDAYIDAFNTQDQPVTITAEYSASMSFYSTVEFTPVSQGD